MTTRQTDEFDTEDVEYLRHGDKAFLARLYVPRGPGPFPAVVEVHGGAWGQFDRLRGKSVHEALARGGIAVVAIDFRQAEEGRYPGSVADVNYAIRWTKANAERLRSRADMVGISGNSTGGHLAMLNAMRPDDPRYAAIPLPPGAPAVDATVRCVTMLWPVINPLGRYRNVKHLATQPDTPEWAHRLIGFHDRYWPGEAEMAEGNPMLLLERGEAVRTPPTMWIQAATDPVHNYVDREHVPAQPECDRFAQNYRRAQGSIEVEIFEAPPMFTTVHPTLPESVEALGRLVGFVQRHIAGSA